jgi:hypothetical protein
MSTGRTSKRNFARQNKTSSGLRRQTETALKIEDLRSNKTTGKLSYDQQPEFRRLSEFYITIFLNKLKIVENTPCKKWKNLNKTSMAKAMGPFRDSQAPSCSPDRCTG